MEKQSKVVAEREELVLAWLKGEVAKRDLLEAYETSRKRVCKWVKRYQTGGRPALADRSRAPKSHGRAISPEVQAAIVRMKRRYKSWGARKIRKKLSELSAELELPSEATVHRVLKRQGLTHRRLKRRRVPQWTGKFTAGDQPNRVWRADYKGLIVTGDGERCEPLTVTDAKSRYLIVLQPARGTGHKEAWRAFRAAFVRYGLPEVILTDNGNPFVTTSLTGLTRLGVMWAKLGIRHERIEPGRPQQNGSHERFHGTLAQETARPPAATRARQVRRFARFRRYYNMERPHEALGQVTPASRYRPSLRRWSGTFAAPSYPAHLQPRRVRSNGMIKWQGGTVYIGEVLSGELVGVQPGIPCRVHFCDLVLGTIEGPRGAQILQRTTPPPRGRRRASTTQR